MPNATPPTFVKVVHRRAQVFKPILNFLSLTGAEETTYLPKKGDENLPRHYQITIRQGSFEFIVFDGDRHRMFFGPNLQTLDDAKSYLGSQIRRCRWKPGPCRARDMDTEVWSEIGIVGEAPPTRISPQEPCM